MSNKVPLTISAENISFFAKGKMYNVPANGRLFDEVTALIQNDEHTAENLIALVDRASQVEKRI